jgi:hypothetical protein
MSRIAGSTIKNLTLNYWQPRYISVPTNEKEKYIEKQGTSQLEK